MLGPATGSNMAIDANEIMARSNGSVATLYLNSQDGNVQIGGALVLGNQVVTSTGGCDSAGGISVSCPSGKRVIGGGCSSGAAEEEIEESRPVGDTGWHCRLDTCPSQFGDWKAHAICLRLE